MLKIKILILAAGPSSSEWSEVTDRQTTKYKSYKVVLTDDSRSGLF
jgi:hypothetical protein